MRPFSPALTPFIESLDFSTSTLAPALERILPGGRIHLMINLHEDQFRTYHGPHLTTVERIAGIAFQGPNSRSTVIDTALMRHLITVSFHPGAAAAFTPIPLSQLQNQLVDINALWRHSTQNLRERLLGAPSIEAQRAVLETALLENLNSRAHPDPAMTFAARRLTQGQPIKNVTSALGLLPKTFLRRFVHHTGLTPKRFARLQRFQRLIQNSGDPRTADWADLAAHHGYADQSHLIHEFREMAGITPSAYRPKSLEACNHSAV